MADCTVSGGDGLGICRRSSPGIPISRVALKSTGPIRRSIPRRGPRSLTVAIRMRSPIRAAGHISYPPLFAPLLALLLPPGDAKPGDRLVLRKPAVLLGLLPRMPPDHGDCLRRGFARPRNIQAMVSLARRGAVAAATLPTLNCLQRGQVGVVKLYLLLIPGSASSSPPVAPLPLGSSAASYWHCRSCSRSCPCAAGRVSSLPGNGRSGRGDIASGEREQATRTDKKDVCPTSIAALADKNVRPHFHNKSPGTAASAPFVCAAASASFRRALAFPWASFSSSSLSRQCLSVGTRICITWTRGGNSCSLRPTTAAWIHALAIRIPLEIRACRTPPIAWVTSVRHLSWAARTTAWSKHSQPQKWRWTRRTSNLFLFMSRAVFALALLALGVRLARHRARKIVEPCHRLRIVVRDDAGGLARCASPRFPAAGPCDAAGSSLARPLRSSASGHCPGGASAGALIPSALRSASLWRPRRPAGLWNHHLAHGGDGAAGPSRSSDGPSGASEQQLTRRFQSDPQSGRVNCQRTTGQVAGCSGSTVRMSLYLMGEEVSRGGFGPLGELFAAAITQSFSDLVRTGLCPLAARGESRQNLLRRKGFFRKLLRLRRACG